MLKITDDEVHRALILEPLGALTRADFAALAERFDAWVGRTDQVPDLVIHAPGFPGWADFGAMVEHLKFIRGHQRRIAKVALVSDARILELAPWLARHFVSAEIRRFPADALEAALAWTASPREDAGGITVIDGLPDDVVGLQAAGVVSARDYTEVIAPLIEERLKRHDRLGLLYRIGPEFEGFTAGAIWNDARVGLAHLGAFTRIAVISDIDWIRRSVQIFAPLIPGAVQVFSDSELDQAKAWVATPGSE